MANNKAWLEMRKAALSTIDMTNFLELILKQMNYQRMKGVDLIDDLDKLVNWYLWICKKYPEPEEAKPDTSTPKSSAPKKEVANDSPTPAQGQEPAKKKTADTTPPASKKPAKKPKAKAKKSEPKGK